MNFPPCLLQVWLTNLEHIREHRLGGLPSDANAGDGRARNAAADRNTHANKHVLAAEDDAAKAKAMAAAFRRNSGLGDDDDDEEEEDDEDDEAAALRLEAAEEAREAAELEALLRPPPDRGLPLRRDTAAILAVNSQIPSVAPGRTWASVPRPQDMGSVAPSDPYRHFKPHAPPGRDALPAPPPGWRRLLSCEPEDVDPLTFGDTSNRNGSSSSGSATRHLHIMVDRLAMSDVAEAFAANSDAEASDWARAEQLRNDANGTTAVRGETSPDWAAATRAVAANNTATVGYCGYESEGGEAELEAKQDEDAAFGAPAWRGRPGWRTGGRGSKEHPALWRITAYDRSNGAQGRCVVPERVAKRAVAAAAAQGLHVCRALQPQAAAAGTSADAGSIVEESAVDAVAAEDASHEGNPWYWRGARSDGPVHVQAVRMSVARELEPLGAQRVAQARARDRERSLLRTPEVVEASAGGGGAVANDANNIRGIEGSGGGPALPRPPPLSSSVAFQRWERGDRGPAKRGFLLQLSLAQYAAGMTPVVVVARLLPLRQHVPKEEATLKPQWSQAHFSVADVKARLGLVDAPVRDLAWWLPSSGNVGTEEWTRLASHLRVRISPDAVEQRQEAAAKLAADAAQAVKTVKKEAQRADSRKKAGVRQAAGAYENVTNAHRTLAASQMPEAYGDEVEVGLGGSDEPLDDPMAWGYGGAMPPPFDPSCADAAALLLPLLRWAPLDGPLGEEHAKLQLQDAMAGRGDGTGGEGSSGVSTRPVAAQGRGEAHACPQGAAFTLAVHGLDDLKDDAPLASSDQPLPPPGTGAPAALAGGPLVPYGAPDRNSNSGASLSSSSELALVASDTNHSPNNMEVSSNLSEGTLTGEWALAKAASTLEWDRGGGTKAWHSDKREATRLAAAAAAATAYPGPAATSALAAARRAAVAAEQHRAVAVEAARFAATGGSGGVEDIGGDLWEDLSEWDPDAVPLSMLASGLAAQGCMLQVPGTTVVPASRARPGMWFQYAPVLAGGALPTPEVTRVVAHHFRPLGGPNGPTGPNWHPGGMPARLARAARQADGRFKHGDGKLSRADEQAARDTWAEMCGRGASNSVAVALTLALDTPLLSPPLVAWVHQCLNAPSPDDETPENGVLPFQVNAPVALRKCQVETPLDARVSEPIAVLTAAEDPLDYAIDPVDPNAAAKSGGDGLDDYDEDDGLDGAGSLASTSVASTTTGARLENQSVKTKNTNSQRRKGNKSAAGGQTLVGHRRHWTWRHFPSGMRHVLTLPLMFPDPVVAPRLFGLTSRGALPNAAKCGESHRWCSSEACRKSLTRLRDASDYAKLAQAQGHHGFSDPGLFTAHLRAAAATLAMDEVIAFIEGSKLNIDLRDGNTTVDQLRVLTLEGARARGWPEGDSGRLLTKLAEIRHRTANETSWSVELYQISLGGLKAFEAWQEVMEATREAEAKEAAKQAKLEAAQKIVEAKRQLQRDIANEEIRLKMGLKPTAALPGHPGHGKNGGQFVGGSTGSGSIAARRAAQQGLTLQEQQQQGGGGGGGGSSKHSRPTVPLLGNEAFPSNDPASPLSLSSSDGGGRTVGIGGKSGGGGGGGGGTRAVSHSFNDAADNDLEVDENDDIPEAPLDEDSLIRELAGDPRLLRLLADQLGLPPQIIDELALAADEEEVAVAHAKDEAAAAAAIARKRGGHQHLAEDDGDNAANGGATNGDDADLHDPSLPGYLLGPELEPLRDPAALRAQRAKEAAAFAHKSSAHTLDELPLLADLLTEDEEYDRDAAAEEAVEQDALRRGGGAPGGGGNGAGGSGAGAGATASSGAGGSVPTLKLPKPTVVIPDAKGGGWRKLQREPTGGILGRATATHVQGPMGGSYNTCCELRVVGLVDPEEDVAYDYEAAIIAEGSESAFKVTTLFVSDVLSDTMRLMEIESGRRTREDYMAGGGAYSQVAKLAGLPEGPGNTELRAVESEDVKHLSPEARLLLEEDRGDQLEAKATQEEKLLMAAKNANYDGVVAALDEEAYVDTEDEHGNTPLLLAAQQGSKRLLKELMRRGATLDHQNHAGSTALHFLFAYRHQELGEYMLGKGADNSILNAEGLTCYEGLHKDTVDEI